MLAAGRQCCGKGQREHTHSLHGLLLPSAHWEDFIKSKPAEQPSPELQQGALSHLASHQPSSRAEQDLSQQDHVASPNLSELLKLGKVQKHPCPPTAHSENACRACPRGGSQADSPKLRSLTLKARDACSSTRQARPIPQASTYSTLPPCESIPSSWQQRDVPTSKSQAKQSPGAGHPAAQQR